MTRYTQTDQQLHWLSQILAKVNRTFVQAEEDDSHTNLYFDALGNRIMSRWIKAGDSNIIFTLNLDNLRFEVLDIKQQIIASFETISHTAKEIEKNIEEVLPSLGLDSKGFSKELHFEIPAYSFKEDPIPRIDEDSLKVWRHFRQIANEACSLLLGHAQVEAEIRIWPHHFDTGIYTMINDNLGLGFGLAMEDSMAGAPYFYVSGYPKTGAMDYIKLPESEAWKWEVGEHWKGAILPIDQLESKTNSEQKHILKNYLIEIFQWFIKQS